MDGADQELDPGEALTEMLEFLTVRPDGDSGNAWVGDPPQWFGDYLFGGLRHRPGDRRRHPRRTRGPPAAFAARLLPAARSSRRTRSPTSSARSATGARSRARHVDASQDGKPVLDDVVFVHRRHRRLRLRPPRWTRRPCARGNRRPSADRDPGLRAIVGPTPPAADGTRESTHRMWFRIPSQLPDDEHLHTALLGSRPTGPASAAGRCTSRATRTGMVSLDHAAWFHRPARADDWLFYDVQSLVNAGGRGLLRGVMRDTDGQRHRLGRAGDATHADHRPRLTARVAGAETGYDRGVPKPEAHDEST